MGPVLYDVMLQLSRSLTDEYIDERQEEVEIYHGNRRRLVTNHTVFVRGATGGRALVVSYHDYYFLDLHSQAYLRDILEVFVAADHLGFEGECRRRGVLDRIARWFGGGGLRGPHSVFDACRVDQAEACPLVDFERPEFAARLQAMSGRDDCVKVQLQARTGVNAVFRAYKLRGGLPRIDALVRECAALAAA